MIAELTDAEIESLLRVQVVGRIGCHADGLTYVVPVIYAWEDGCVYVVTIDGQKTRMMRTNPEVCFEVDEYEPSGSWRSVVAYGRYEELPGEGVERARAVLAARFPARAAAAASEREPRGGGRPVVAFRIRIREATGRSVRR